MTDIMMDIETIGTQPGCGVLSIGLVAFDRQTFETFESMQIDIDPESLEAHGLGGSATTIAWWMQPEQEEGRLATFDRALIRVNVETAAASVTQFCKQYLQGCIWSKGSFDMPIVAAMLKRVGYPAPWGFWQERDLRSFFDALGFSKADQMSVHRPKHLPKHQSSGDAFYQIIQMEMAAERAKAVR